MAKKKETILTKDENDEKEKVIAHVQRVEEVQKELILELEKIKKEIKEMGVLGLGAAKEKG